VCIVNFQETSEQHDFMFSVRKYAENCHLCRLGFPTQITPNLKTWVSALSPGFSGLKTCYHASQTSQVDSSCILLHCISLECMLTLHERFNQQTTNPRFVLVVHITTFTTTVHAYVCVAFACLGACYRDTLSILQLNMFTVYINNNSTEIHNM